MAVKKEQRIGADDQDARQVDEVLRIEHQVEDVETPRRQVEQHRLAIVPHQPGQPVEHELREKDQGPAPLDEPPADGAGVDLLCFLVERDDFDGCVFVVRR